MSMQISRRSSRVAADAASVCEGAVFRHLVAVKLARTREKLLEIEPRGGALVHQAESR